MTTVYADNDEYFSFDTLEEAPERVWDNFYWDNPTYVTVYEGEITDELLYDDSTKEELNRVINIKERTFKVLKDAEEFDMDNFEEVGSATN